MKKPIGVMITVVLVLWSTLAGAGESAEALRGFDAYKRGDYATAWRIWQPLALKGDAVAQGGLGMAYFFGQGVPQDYAMAAQWYHRAAAQGFLGAQYGLGILYEFGWGVPQNDVEAHFWYSIAAAHHSGVRRDLATRNRDRMAERMTPAQLAVAQERASTWRQK